MQSQDPENQLDLDHRPAGLPVYEPPSVATYTDEQLLEALGPAQAQPYAG
jgi:hypothetical protein